MRRSPVLAPMIAMLPFAGLAACAAEGVSGEGSSAAECQDAADNDGDGLVDCEDPGCSAWPSCEGAGDDDDSEEPGNWDLCVNEFMASNGVTIADDGGQYPDWIELFNLTSDVVPLGGYTITDDLGEPDKHALAADLSLPASGHLLLWADNLPELGSAHLGFQLAREGGDIGLYSPAGAPINHLHYDEQATDWSAARIPDGAIDSWVIDTTPTPGEANE